MVEVMNEVMEVSVDLYISKIYEDEPQFNEYIKANAAERAKMRSTKYLELPFFSTKFIRRFIDLYLEEIRNATHLDRLIEQFNAKFEEVFGTENELNHAHSAIYNQIKRRIGEAGRICWYKELHAKLYKSICGGYDDAKVVNDIFFSSKLIEDIENLNFYKEMNYYTQYSYFRGARLPIYDCYNDILEKRKAEWYTKEIYGNETNHPGETNQPTFYDYINAPADKRKQFRSTLSLPFFQTKFIRKFIQLFVEDFCSSIKNGTKNLAYAYDRSYELFKDFRHLFMAVFGSSQDFASNHKTYLQVRKRIGTEARDYWYEEVEALIPGVRSRLS